MSEENTASTAEARAESPKEESFFSHLLELRTRLTRAALALVVVFIALMIWPGQKEIFNILFQPMVNALAGNKIIVTDPIDSFMIPIKLVLMVSLFIALPAVLYQVWAFVAPGLYTHEKQLAIPVLVSSSLLFYCGVAFCHFIVFAKVFTFFREIAPESVAYTPDIAKVFSFVSTMFLAFGVTFEIPVAVVLLVRMGIVSLEKLKEIRGYIWIAAFVIAAVVTPPDVLSQLMLAIPMCLLYEVGLIFARFVGSRKAAD